jgi:hypothetical protein
VAYFTVRERPLLPLGWVAGWLNQPACHPATRPLHVCVGCVLRAFTTGVCGVLLWGCGVHTHKDERGIRLRTRAVHVCCGPLAKQLPSACQEVSRSVDRSCVCKTCLSIRAVIGLDGQTVTPKAALLSLGLFQFPSCFWESFGDQMHAPRLSPV